MKNSKILSSVLTAVFAMGALVACNTTKHECQHVCEICGACYDESCKDQACSNKCQDHTLSAPTIALNNNAVTWTAVEHAKGYDVYINNSLKTTVTTTSYTITETTVGSYEIKVASKGNGAQIASSGKSNGVTYQVNPTKLGTPVLTISGNVVSWPAIANAGSYDIFVNDVSKGTQTELSYTITETIVGSYEVKVMAKAGSAQFADSDKSTGVSYTVDPTKLATPSLTLTNNVVTWSEIANASSYEVFVNDTSKGTQTELSYTITETTIGTYEVKVMAKTGSAQFIDSDKSTGVTYTVSATKLATPELSLQSNVVTWSEVANAASYEVFVNDVSKGTQTALSYTITETAVGSYEVKVMAKTGSAQFIDSDKSTGVTYTINPTKLATPAVTLTDKTVSWEGVSNATGYEVYDGSTKLADVTTTSYKINGVALGDHSITVKAVSTNPSFTESDPSTASTYTATLLNTPVIVTSESRGDIVFDSKLGALRTSKAGDTDKMKALQFVAGDADGQYRVKNADGQYLYPMEASSWGTYRVLATVNPTLDTTFTAATLWNLKEIEGHPGKYHFVSLRWGTEAQLDQRALCDDIGGGDYVSFYWENILAATTTFTVRTCDVEIASTPQPYVSGIDFSKKVVVSSMYNDTVMTYDSTSSAMVVTTPKSSVADLNTVAWTFESAGDDNYYIKLADGSYLKWYQSGSTAVITKDTKEETDAFKWYLISHGGEYYSLSSHGMETTFVIYLYVWATVQGVVSINVRYTCAGDLMFRFANI